MHTGHSGMEKFGYIDKLNGLDNLSAWKEKPCNNVSNSLSNVKWVPIQMIFIHSNRSRLQKDLSFHHVTSPKTMWSTFMTRICVVHCHWSTPDRWWRMASMWIYMNYQMMPTVAQIRTILASMNRITMLYTACRILVHVNMVLLCTSRIHISFKPIRVWLKR